MQLRWIYFWSVAVLALWGATHLLWLFGLDSARSGQYGDAFGAVNSLFSGLGFVGVLVALGLQRQQLRETQREVHASSQIQQKTADLLARQVAAQQIVNDIQTIQALIEVVKYQIINHADLRPTPAEASSYEAHAARERLLGERYQFLKDELDRIYIRRYPNGPRG